MQGAIGDQHASETSALLLAVPLGEHHPAVALRSHLQHPGIELVMLLELKVLGVIPEIPAHFAVMGIGRYRVGHGEFGKFGHALGGDQVRAVVHGAVGVVDIPEPADIRVLFEADEGDAEFLQIASAGQTHGAGTDDGVHIS